MDGPSLLLWCKPILLWLIDAQKYGSNFFPIGKLDIHIFFQNEQARGVLFAFAICADKARVCHTVHIWTKNFGKRQSLGQSIFNVIFFITP